MFRAYVYIDLLDATGKKSRNLRLVSEPVETAEEAERIARVLDCGSNVTGSGFEKREPLKVVTGFSSKDDGFLIVTSQSLTKLAQSMSMAHQIVKGQDFFSTGEGFSADEIQAIDDGDTPRGCYRVYAAIYKENENLASAVCW